MISHIPYACHGYDRLTAVNDDLGIRQSSAKVPGVEVTRLELWN